MPEEIIDILLDNASNFELVYDNGLPIELRIRLSHINETTIEICDILEKMEKTPDVFIFMLVKLRSQYWVKPRYF